MMTVADLRRMTADMDPMARVYICVVAEDDETTTTYQASTIVLKGNMNQARNEVEFNDDGRAGGANSLVFFAYPEEEVKPS